jgi:hypothetical protein
MADTVRRLLAHISHMCCRARRCLAKLANPGLEWKARDAVGLTTFVPADEARRRLGMPR